MASRKPKKDETPTLEQIKLDAGTITSFAISELAVSPFNVRKDATPDEELIASIAAHGLLQPLIGYAFAGDHESGATILICAGQRRLLALKKLVERGQLTADTLVPVRQVDENTAIEISLAENLERKSMSPIDEFKAFAALIETGRYNEQLIADRFGFTRRYVYERLRLAALHPEVAEALQKGEFGIEAARCFCLVSDPEQQLAVYKQAKRATYDKFKPTAITTIINSAGLPCDGPAGKFIGGKKAYEKAGGTFEVTEMDDLFRTHSWGGKRAEVMKDAAIVSQLWSEAWSKVDPKLRKEAVEMFGFELANVSGVLHDPSPNKEGGIKAPSEHFKFETSGYDYHSYGRDSQVTKTFFGHALKKFIKEGGRIYVRAKLGNDGKPYLDRTVLYVTNDMKPHLEKLVKDNQTREQKKREAEALERSKGPIEREALYLYWATLTPEQKLEGMKFDRVWRQNQAEEDGGHFNCEFLTRVPWSLVEPFMAQAEANAEARRKEQEEAEAKAAAEAEVAAAARVEHLAKFAALRVTGKFPGYAILETEQGEVVFTLKENGDVEVQNFEGDDWEVSADEAFEQALDFANTDPDSTLKWWDSYGDYEAELIHDLADAEGTAEAANDETATLEAAE